METLDRAIERNRRRAKYRRLLRLMLLNHYEHEDAGRIVQAARIIGRIKAILRRSEQ